MDFSLIYFWLMNWLDCFLNTSFCLLLKWIFLCICLLFKDAAFFHWLSFIYLPLVCWYYFWLVWKIFLNIYFFFRCAIFIKRLLLVWNLYIIKYQTSDKVPKRYQCLESEVFEGLYFIKLDHFVLVFNVNPVNYIAVKTN